MYGRKCPCLTVSRVNFHRPASVSASRNGITRGAPSPLGPCTRRLGRASPVHFSPRSPRRRSHSEFDASPRISAGSCSRRALLGVHARGWRARNRSLIDMLWLQLWPRSTSHSTHMFSFGGFEGDFGGGGRSRAEIPTTGHGLSTLFSPGWPEIPGIYPRRVGHFHPKGPGSPCRGQDRRVSYAESGRPLSEVVGCPAESRGLCTPEYLRTGIKLRGLTIHFHPAATSDLC